MSESKAREARRAAERQASPDAASQIQPAKDATAPTQVGETIGTAMHETVEALTRPAAAVTALLGGAFEGLGQQHDPEPDLRWRGNQKQQYKAAEARARQRGHHTSTSYIEYGPIGTVDRFVLRCSCGEKSTHRTEARRIAAEREHMLEKGKKS